MHSCSFLIAQSVILHLRIILHPRSNHFHRSLQLHVPKPGRNYEMVALLDSLSIHSALSVKHTHIKEWMTLLKLQLTIKLKLINLIILTLNKLFHLFCGRLLVSMTLSSMDFAGTVMTSILLST